VRVEVTVTAGWTLVEVEREVTVVVEVVVTLAVAVVVEVVVTVVVTVLVLAGGAGFVLDVLEDVELDVEVLVVVVEEELVELVEVVELFDDESIVNAVLAVFTPSVAETA
jgi:hypothetical protein